MSDSAMLRAWIALIGAIVLEVTGTGMMKISQQASPFWMISGFAAMLFCVAVSYWLLAKASQRIPIGVAYACWEGLGLALITLLSALLGERLTLQRVLAMLAVFAGILCIHHGTGHGTAPDTPRTGSSETGQGASL